MKGDCDNIGDLTRFLTSGTPRRLHLIGVAGSGMSGIAGLLLAMGHTVTGSDKTTTLETDRLRGLGLLLHTPECPEAVASAELVIYSSAIRSTHPDYAAANRLGVPLVRRAAALAAALRARKGIVVAGMHGKTTTSSMAAHVLRVAGLRPSHYVGAEIPILGTNAHWDPDGEYFVAEGDESDGTLALYNATAGIVLNIEEEHLDFYTDLKAIEAVYRQFSEQTERLLVWCADCPNSERVCGDHPGGVSYGESAGARYRCEDIQVKEFQSHFRVTRDGRPLGGITLNVPGRHNVANATAVIALATELGIGFQTIREALESFRGAKRRFEIRYRSERYMVVDDYGHHPTEVRATLATARSTGRRRIITMFQPHRYSRTAALRDEFGLAFSDADFILVADIYAASETPIPGVSGQTIVDAIVAETGHEHAHYIPDRREQLHTVARMMEPGDLVLTLGAGNHHELATLLVRDLRIAEELQQLMGRGTVRMYEPLSKHTTMRVGGPAQYWIEPETEEGFARVVRYCTESGLPLMIIGRGSNLLVRDAGVRGVVAYLGRGEFRELAVRENRITAGVGVRQRELAIAAKEAGLGGFEWFEGIPGNVGGALRMNAGAMGVETFGQVVTIRYVDSMGNFHTKTPDEMAPAYRNVEFLRHNYALSATFEGVAAPSAEIARRMDESMRKRRTSQPRGSSAGCVFKNPEGIAAGKIIDELGLKGTRVGEARVSDVHGNFIVNEGNASAADILELIERIRQQVRCARGIELHTEVQIVGEAEAWL
jgi:UDP-N-acetylmuramate--L-alanine ligase/UDP-N-acetylenolpyruvoylglucosamine reductase